MHSTEPRTGDVTHRLADLEAVLVPLVPVLERLQGAQIEQRQVIVIGDLSAMVAVNTTINRLEAAQGRQTLLQANLEELRSKSEDTDSTEAVSTFSIQETVCKASLEIGGRAIQPCLLDYPR